MQRFLKWISVVWLILLVAFNSSAEIWAETAASLPSLASNPQSEMLRGSFVEKFGKHAASDSSFLLARNQAGDNWKVVIDSNHRVSLVNDHEQLNGSVRRFRFEQRNSKRESYHWPLLVTIDPEHTKIVVQNQENRRTIYLISSEREIMVRSDFNGRKIMMASRESSADGKWKLNKVLFDYDPFRGRGSLVVGSSEGREDIKQYASVSKKNVLGAGFGYLVS